MALHRETGPGLLETVYEAVLARDLEARGLRAARQVPIPIELRGLQFDEGFRADLIVEDTFSCGTQIRGEGHEGAPQAG
ncbi:MAG TPA: GxxExxY protein, partial [Candidatus Hydrogenedentes bacterium]|nr:GxxExxY protein [Candidatus Hydrogenedentota bacterium]